MYEIMLAVILCVESALKSAQVCIPSWYGRSYDINEMLESGAQGFSIGQGEIKGREAAWQGEGPSGHVVNDSSTSNVPTRGKDFLPKGAPKNWAAWEGRARIAMDRAIARRAVKHLQGPTLDEEYDFVEDSRDVDDTRWETPGYALDPYWSTCPAVVEDAAITNSRERWTEWDGEHKAPEASEDFTALDKVTLDELRRQWYHMVPRTKKGKQSLYHWGVGLKSLTDIESTNRVDYISRKGSDDTAYMSHGRQSREDTFWRIVVLLQQGEAALATGDGSRGRNFLAWLSRRWNVDLESKAAKGNDYRRAAGMVKTQKDGNVKAENKTMACGRGYYLTYAQMVHLRDRRKGMLRRYSHISGLTDDNAYRFIRAYSMKYWGLYQVKDTPDGTRQDNLFGVNPLPRQENLRLARPTMEGPSFIALSKGEAWKLTPNAIKALADKKKRFTYTDGEVREVTTHRAAVARIIRRSILTLPA